jgi:hypothetical protein
MHNDKIDVTVTLPVRVTYSYNTVDVKNYYTRTDECPIEIEDIEIILPHDNSTTSDFSIALEKNTAEYDKLLEAVTERLTQSFLAAKHDMRYEGL